MASQPERVESSTLSWQAQCCQSRIRVRTDGFYRRFMLGLRSLSSPTDVFMIFSITVLIWLTETVKYWFVMHAFDFSVSFLVLMLMNGLVNLATTLPAAPGYIGTFDTPGIRTLVTFGVDPSIAASYTFTLHAALWVPVTAAGRLFLLALPPGLKDVAAARQQRQAESR